MDSTGQGRLERGRVIFYRLIGRGGKADKGKVGFLHVAAAAIKPASRALSHRVGAACPNYGRMSA